MKIHVTTQPNDLVYSGLTFQRVPRTQRTKVFVFGLDDLKESREAARRAMAEQFPGVPVKLSFSRTAGCRCGCSPGFTSDVRSQVTVFVDTEE